MRWKCSAATDSRSSITPIWMNGPSAPGAWAPIQVAAEEFAGDPRRIRGTANVALTDVTGPLSQT